NKSFGCGGAIFIQTNITAENLNETNFLMRDLTFSGCSAVNSIGNNIHIESVNTSNAGIAIAINSLISVIDIPNLYTTFEYLNYYMGIDQSKVGDGTIIDNHEPLFLAVQTDSIIKQYYIRSSSSLDENDCSSTSPCKTINYILSQSLPTGFVKGLSIIIINLLSNTSDQNNIILNSGTELNNIVTVQSNGYSPEAEQDSYLKRQISTSSFSNSLFTIRETGDLSLLGLHFDNLNPSSTNPLISIRSDDNTQQPNITIIDCGWGAAINAKLQTGSQLRINDSEFIQCKGSNISGGAIYLNINNNGQATISNSSFNHCEATHGGGIYAEIYSGGQLTIDGQCNFIQCKASIRGGGIFTSIEGLNSQLTLEDEVKFDCCTCNSTSSQGGGAQINVGDHGTSIINKVQFNSCTSSEDGGGIIIGANNPMKYILNGTQFTNCEAYRYGGGFFITSQNSVVELFSVIIQSCKSLSEGGGCSIQCLGTGDVLSFTGELQFNNCTSGWGGGI
ncbi:MAG: hypothetical protein EZS28_038520, partial [Streblomastix strix]